MLKTVTRFPADISPAVLGRIATLSPINQHRLKVQVARVRDERAGWWSGRRLDREIAVMEEARMHVRFGSFAALMRGPK